MSEMKSVSKTDTSKETRKFKAKIANWYFNRECKCWPGSCPWDHLSLYQYYIRMATTAYPLEHSCHFPVMQLAIVQAQAQNGQFGQGSGLTGIGLLRGWHQWIKRTCMNQ